MELSIDFEWIESFFPTSATYLEIRFDVGSISILNMNAVILFFRFLIGISSARKLSLAETLWRLLLALCKENDFYWKIFRFECQSREKNCLKTWNVKNKVFSFNVHHRLPYGQHLCKQASSRVFALKKNVRIGEGEEKINSTQIEKKWIVCNESLCKIFYTTNSAQFLSAYHSIQRWTLFLFWEHWITEEAFLAI